MKAYDVNWELVVKWVSSEGRRLKQERPLELTDFTNAIERADKLLASKPLSFGEPHYKYKHLHLIVCIGFCGPLVVRYAVHRANRIVFVSELAWRT